LDEGGWRFVPGILFVAAAKRAMFSAKIQANITVNLLISLLMPEFSRAEYWLLRIAQYLNK
jgi:hypothetical protein